MNIRITRLFVAVILVIGLLATSVSAANVNESKGNTSAANFNIVIVNIGISENTVTCKGILTGKIGITTKIKTRLYLQKYSAGSWKNVKSWSGTKRGTSYIFTKTATVSKGKYRTKAVFKVYAGKRVETITRYSVTATR